MDVLAQQKRCLVYTRKSSKSGLELEYNSLQAQEETCNAYILSQKHEGWVACGPSLNDGGFSGGNMNRPALQALLEEVRQRKVDIIVVYKIDRLTRSLKDFVRLMDVFEKHKVSFVSVSQQFNTTTSLGILILNVLLSFAQFERELTSERIRDKIAATRAKRMWTSGRAPIGYDIVDKRLVINQQESCLVRHIFERYLALGSVYKLSIDLDRTGYRTRTVERLDGSLVGGVPFIRCHLFRILRCVVYIGKIPYKGTSYQGVHEPLLDLELWDQVQTLLNSKHRAFHQGLSAKLPSLLKGKIIDAEGRIMSPSGYPRFRNRKQQRYYVSQALVQGRAFDPRTIVKVSAPETEALVEHIFYNQFLDRKVLEPIDQTLEFKYFIACNALAAVWRDLDSRQRMCFVRAVLVSIRIISEAVILHIRGDIYNQILLNFTQDRFEELEPLKQKTTEGCYCLSVDAKLRKVGGKSIYIIPPGGMKPIRRVNPVLVKALANAYHWNYLLVSGKATSQQELCIAYGVRERRVTQLLPLSWLAPDIVEAVLNGTQPADLTLTKMLKHQSSDWREQRRNYGFPAR